MIRRLKYGGLLLLALCGMKLAHAQSNLRINEVMPVNHNAHFDAFREADPWVELYNYGSKPVQLTGLILSTKPDTTGGFTLPKHEGKKHELPADSGLVFWLDPGTRQANDRGHTTCKPGKSGGGLWLFNSKGELLDSLVFPTVMVNQSFGRNPADLEVIAVLHHPTPNQRNAWRDRPLPAAPVLSVPSGNYAEPFEVSISQEGASSYVVYSLNGYHPMTKGKRTLRRPIKVSGMRVIRAVGLDTTGEYSPLVTGSYLVGRQHTLPVVSIAADGWDAWYHQNRMITDREIPAHISYFDVLGQTLFSTDVALRLGGGASRMLPQKSMSIKWRDAYGSVPFEGNLWPNRYHDEVNELTLRNSGNGGPKVFFKDAMLHELFSFNEAVDCLDAVPCVVYVNGKYWGIYNIREKKSKNYVVNNHNYARNEVDMVELTNGQPTDGTSRGMEKFNELLAFARTADMSDAATRNRFWFELDMANFLTYQAIQIYIANTDWPQQNVKAWRPNNPNGKWRFFLFDLDQGFKPEKVDLNTLEYALGKNMFLKPEHASRHTNSTLLFSTVMKDPKARELFTQIMDQLMENQFAPENVEQQIERHRQRLLPEISRHLQRWAPEEEDGTFSRRMVPADSVAWERAIDRLREFAQQRPTHMRNMLDAQFGARVQLTVSKETLAKGMVFVDGEEVLEGDAPLLFYPGKRVAVQILPNPGSQFSHWKPQQHIDYDNKNYHLTITEDTELEAVFR